MSFFGLKQGQDLEKPVAHTHQEFPGVPLPSHPGGGGEGHLLTRVLIFETQRHRLSMQTAWQRMTNPHS